jgi:hypothetical protein
VHIESNFRLVVQVGSHFSVCPLFGGVGHVRKNEMYSQNHIVQPERNISDQARDQVPDELGRFEQDAKDSSDNESGLQEGDAAGQYIARGRLSTGSEGSQEQFPFKFEHIVVQVNR